MAVETVKVYVKDQLNSPIVGVLVRVFDAAGAVFITQDYTVLVSGRAVAEFALDGNDPPNSYTIRLSKTGVAFDGALGSASKSPQLITIYSPPESAPNETNNFEVVGQTFVLPTATNPRLCRCSGFFKDPAGRPLAALDFTIINQFDPTVVDGYAVLSSKIDLRTDKDGYVEVDLYRNGHYHSMIESVEAPEADDTGAIIFERNLVVPDRSSVNLVDLIFPIVTGVAWDPETLEVMEGETLDVYPTVTTSDYRELAGSAFEDVIYDTDDHTVAVVTALPDKLVIAGVGPGTANLTAVRKDQSIVSIPAAPITGQPIAITVLPV
jgi:uncharacterized protein YjdB